MEEEEGLAMLIAHSLSPSFTLQPLLSQQLPRNTKGKLCIIALDCLCVQVDIIEYRLDS
ncbi:hypothetical protein E2542_SST16998 [Spatholobus suberectus]|nr:hypothetical protein E2542_SST16998 [Spatholobus suberectus]